MQLPGPGHPHTRARTVHWIATAAALAAVIGTAALASPPAATATSGRAAAGPDPAAASYPMDCGAVTTVVTDQAAVDFDGDGRAETVAAVRCDAGSGTPPHGLYVLTRPAESGAAPRVAATLLDPDQGMTVSRLSAGSGTVTVRLLGYSSADVPRCCPDLRRDVTWSWRDGHLERRAGSVAGSA